MYSLQLNENKKTRVALPTSNNEYVGFKSGVHHSVDLSVSQKNKKRQEHYIHVFIFFLVINNTEIYLYSISSIFSFDIRFAWHKAHPDNNILL